MKYWLTTQWPPGTDYPHSFHHGVYLQEGKEFAGNGISVGDLVFSYQYATGPILVLGMIPEKLFRENQVVVVLWHYCELQAHLRTGNLLHLSKLTMMDGKCFGGMFVM
jgi:hypothetical protein